MFSREVSSYREFIPILFVLLVFRLNFAGERRGIERKQGHGEARCPIGERVVVVGCQNCIY